MSDKKKELLKEAKALGLNLNEHLSIYDIEKAIAEKKEEESPAPKQQPSSRRGEY